MGIFMENNLIREHSFSIASQLGYLVKKDLPFLDAVENKRSLEEVIKRLLCLHVVAACAYGFDRKKANKWIRNENIDQSLEPSEKLFLEKGVGDIYKFKLQIEGMWALAWSLGLTPVLDFSNDCDSQFVMSLPNLKKMESSFILKSKIKQRSFDEIFRECDLSYCLTWALRNDAIIDQKKASTLKEYVIFERRRALEWLIGFGSWDDISLDT